MRPALRAPLVSAALVLLFVASGPLTSAQAVDDEELDQADYFPNSCRDVDEMMSMATGMANPLSVMVNDEPVEPDFLETGVAQATQVGPGKAGDRTALVDVAVPDEDDPLVTAQLVAGRVDLDVDGMADGMESEAWSNSRVAYLNVMNDLVTADLVRGFAYARADVRSARTYTDPSTILNLQVAGISYTDVAPGTNITLPVLFGAGSYVTVYERIDHSRMPTEDEPFYVADARVRMIHVHLTNAPLLGEVDVIAGEAYARAVSPTPFCGLAQSVEAAAYTTRVRNALDNDDSDGLHGILVGEQHIGVTGGSGHQQLLGQTFDLSGSDLRLNVTETDVTGEIVAGVSSDSDAMSQVLGLCIRLDTATDECFIEVVVVKAEAHCHADADGASCEGRVEILKLIVDGVDVCAGLGMEGTCTPDTSTDEPTFSVGPIEIWLNQQERVESDGYASIYVRAIRIETPLPQVQTVIISRAYASAAFEHAGTNEETPAWDL